MRNNCINVMANKLLDGSLVGMVIVHFEAIKSNRRQGTGDSPPLHKYLQYTQQFLCFGTTLLTDELRTGANQRQASLDF